VRNDGNCLDTHTATRVVPLTIVWLPITCLPGAPRSWTRSWRYAAS